jgi:hypothetical protein
LTFKYAAFKHEKKASTHSPYFLSNELRSLDSLRICSGQSQGFGKVIHSEFTDTGADTKRFYPVTPEELITEKWLDYRRNTR